MKAIDIAREEAEKLFVTLDEDGLEYIIWEHTGFPSFFGGDNPEATFRNQLQEALRPIAEKQRQILVTPSQWERLKW